MLVRYGEVCYEKGYDVEWKGSQGYLGGCMRKMRYDDE